MEPRIQYAKTSDGVNIAYATAGAGRPLLMMAIPPLTHVQAMWETVTHLYQPLAERFRLVWYDFRGTGLSDRNAIDQRLIDPQPVEPLAHILRAALSEASLYIARAADQAAARAEVGAAIERLLGGLRRRRRRAKSPRTVA